MIISGGENVHPLEVEDVLAAAPGRARGGGDRRRRRAARPARRRGGRRARRPPRSSTRTASPRRSRASSGRASTGSSTRCRRAPRARSCDGCCGTGPSEREHGRQRRSCSTAEGMTEYDGFRVERDAGGRRDDHARRAREAQPRLDGRARPARGVFVELDADEAVRFVVLAGAGGAFTAGGDIAGFLERARGRSRSSRGTSPRRSGARSR